MKGWVNERPSLQSPTPTSQVYAPDPTVAHPSAHGCLQACRCPQAPPRQRCLHTPAASTDGPQRPTLMFTGQMRLCHETMPCLRVALS